MAPAGRRMERTGSGGDGRRVTVRLNGRVIQDVDLNDIKDPAILLKHPAFAESGTSDFWA